MVGHAPVYDSHDLLGFADNEYYDALDYRTLTRKSLRHKRL